MVMKVITFKSTLYTTPLKLPLRRSKHKFFFKLLKHEANMSETYIYLRLSLSQKLNCNLHIHRIDTLN